MKKLKGLSDFVKMSEKEMAKFRGGDDSYELEGGGTMTQTTYSTTVQTNVSTGGNTAPDSQKDDSVTDRSWSTD